MTPELIEATKLLGQTGLSPPTFSEHDRSWLSELKRTESRRNRARERERLTPLSDMAPVFINLKESESLSCPSDRRGRFPI